jgi:hypothetical protein
MKTLAVKQTSTKVLGLALCLIFGLAAVWVVYLGGIWTSSVFFAGFLLGLYLILGTGTIELDEQGITEHTLLGSYRIGWNEITHLEVDKTYSTLVFAGVSKRLVLTGTSSWNGKDKIDALSFLSTQLKERSIEVRKSVKASYRFNKNSRIKS